MEIKTKSGAQLLVECLEQHGVEYIFGIPGAKIDAVFDALTDSKIQLIVSRHEQNAAFSAACYGRLTGKPGVVLVTSGPGVSNLTTGLLTATTEGDPVVAIGGNVARSMRLKEAHQNSENTRIMEPCTKYSVEVQMVENIPEIVANAFRYACMPQAGAVFISIPQDITHEETTLVAPKPLTAISFGPAKQELLSQAAALINQAQQPVILLGMEASRPENTTAIRTLLHKYPMAVVGTYQAAGVISRELVDCFVGRVGLFKNQPGDVLLDAADLVLTIGFNSVEYDPTLWNSQHSKTIIHLNYQPCKVRLAYQPALELLGDIAANLQQLFQHITPRANLHNIELVTTLQNQLLKTIDSGKNKNGRPIHPLRFIYELRKAVNDEATIISDIGTHYMWLSRYFFSYNPHHLLFSNGQLTLGVALPWAIAATKVRPGQQVISISGDGGFLFSANELETAVREQCNFIHFVWCDNTYNMVLEQELLKYNRSSGVDFGYVNLVEFASSFGATGYVLNDPSELPKLLHEAFATPGPTIVEVPIDYSDNPELFKTVQDEVGN